jgi:hypothetical protein
MFLDNGLPNGDISPNLVTLRTMSILFDHIPTAPAPKGLSDHRRY